jgi:hypothetical protein
VEELKTRLIIQAWRPAEAVIYSRVHKWDLAKRKRLSKEEHLQHSQMWVYIGLWRMQAAFAKLPKHCHILKIDFTKEVSREDLVEILKPHVERLR